MIRHPDIRQRKFPIFKKREKKDEQWEAKRELRACARTHTGMFPYIYGHARAVSSSYSSPNSLDTNLKDHVHFSVKGDTMITLEEMQDRMNAPRWNGRTPRQIHFGHCDPFPRTFERREGITYEEYLHEWVSLYARIYYIQWFGIQHIGVEPRWEARISREYSVWLPRNVDEPDLPLNNETADLWHWADQCDCQYPPPPLPQPIRRFLR